MYRQELFLTEMEGRVEFLLSLTESTEEPQGRGTEQSEAEQSEKEIKASRREQAEQRMFCFQTEFVPATIMLSLLFLCLAAAQKTVTRSHLCNLPLLGLPGSQVI